jgi:iron uptake system EfeUOB component EfeO/EfeM
MMRLSYFIFAALLTVASGVSSVSSAAAASPQSAGAERFEVLSVKEVRPALVNTVAALKKGDVAEAKTAFDAYDSAWNGIEVYINTRDKTMYSDLEQNYQAQIAKGLNSPIPDTTALLAQAQAMLAKYDEAISLVENGAPLNPLYDDVARLRIVRANLREVTLALRAGDFAKARKSFAAFDDKWDSIEDIVKARSADSYADIEKGMIQIEQALMPAKPDVDQVTALVKGVMDKYNAVVADVTKDARGH